MPYVSRRWLGGLLTNFGTISKRIKRLHELTDLESNGQLALLPTKERMAREAELKKLEFNLGGVRDMQRPPDAIFVIDLNAEEIAVNEAVRLDIPIVAVVDTNCNPRPVEYVIPGNDDAIRSCELIVSTLGEAILTSATAYQQAEEAKRKREEEERKKREEEQRKKREEEEAKQAAEAAAKAEAEAAAKAAAEKPAGGPAPDAPPAAEPPRRPAPARGRPGRQRRRRRWRQVSPTEIKAADVKALRERTGAAMMDCKAALTEAGGDLDKAIEVLRVKGQASAAKRSGRSTGEGIVTSYVHATGRIGALVEIQCETDFVARNDDFKAFAGEIALHVAAASPRYVSADEVPAEEEAAERTVFEQKAAEEGKPENVRERIVEGQLAKWRKEIALLEQPHVNGDKHDGKTIEQLREEASAKTGENIRIARFARFEVGAEA